MGNTLFHKLNGAFVNNFVFVSDVLKINSVASQDCIILNRNLLSSKIIFKLLKSHLLKGIKERGGSP